MQEEAGSHLTKPMVVLLIAVMMPTLYVSDEYARSF